MKIVCVCWVFVISALAALSCAGDEPNLTLGVISDIHIIGPQAHSMNAETFVRALRWYDAHKVDGVVIAGDLTQYGMVKELEAVGAAWFSVFPDNRRSDGAPVEPLIVYGDHDTGGGVYRQKWARKYYPDEKACVKDLIVNNDRAALWERVFKEKFRPIVHKRVKGYDFILAHYVNVGKGASVTPGLVDFVRATAPKFSPEKPFFYVQHRPIVGTYRSERIGSSADAREALAPYANAFALTAHTHYTLTDEQACWQGDFTCVGTSSLRYVNALSGRENTSRSGTQMPRIQCYESRQGMLFRVYDDRVEIARHDFVADASLGADWIVPVLKAGEKTRWSLADRAKAFTAPQFSAGAKVEVCQTKDGRTKVVFPTVKSAPGRLRAFDYEVAVEAKGADGRWTRGRTKRVFSPGFVRPESKEPATACCLFASGELPDGIRRYVVTPTDAFGQNGQPISSAD